MSYPNGQNNAQSAIPVWGGAMCKDSTGVYSVDPNNWAAAFHYTTPGVVDYVTVTDPVSASTFRQTFTYNGDGTIATRTAWVKQ